MLHVLILEASFAALACAAVGDAAACSPLPAEMRADHLRQQAKQADGIFFGRVRSISRAPVPIAGADIDMMYLEADVDVIEIWKGQRYAIQRVRTPESSAACGFPLRQGEAYLFAVRGVNIVMAVAFRDDK